MRAVILAAGRGSRLSHLNPDRRPKCLLDVGGRSLLARQLQLLKDSGIERADIVVGYEADRIRREVQSLPVEPKISYVLNSRFEQGSTISLLTAQEALTSGNDVLLLDADVLCHPAVLMALVNSAARNCLLMDRAFEPGEEPVKVAVRNGTIVEFRKKLPEGLEYDYLGESVGLFRFGPEVARRISERCAALDADGLSDTPHEEVLRAELLDRPGAIAFEDITGLPWIEIDFDEDLQRAREDVLPLIRKDYPNF